MWLTKDQLQDLKLAELGTNVLIDDSVRVNGSSFISVGSDVRIDAFADLSAGPGNLTIGNFVHLGHGVCVYAAGGVDMADYSGMSTGVMAFSESDDYRGTSLTNPTVPEKFRQIHRGKISLGRHAVVGAGSVILPGVTLGLGSAAGALTLLKRDVSDFEIVSGNPQQAVGRRDGEKLAELERQHAAHL